ELPAPVRITRAAGSSISGPANARICACSPATSAWVRCSIRGCCSISRAVQSAPAAVSSDSDAPRYSVDVMVMAGMVVVVECGTDVCHGQGERVVGRAAGAQRAQRVRQELADQRQRRRGRAQVVEQALAGLLDHRVRPVIADAVAEAVLQVDGQRVALAVVVASPVTGLLAHARQGYLAQACPTRIPDPLLLDRVQRPQRLAQGEGQAGADLEDGEMIAYQRRQRVAGLVVG